MFRHVLPMRRGGSLVAGTLKRGSSPQAGPFPGAGLRWPTPPVRPHGKDNSSLERVLVNASLICVRTARLPHCMEQPCRAGFRGMPTWITFRTSQPARRPAGCRCYAASPCTLPIGTSRISGSGEASLGRGSDRALQSENVAQEKKQNGTQSQVIAEFFFLRDGHHRPMGRGAQHPSLRRGVDERSLGGCLASSTF